MIILGAGLTGLSAAYHGNGLTVYEKERDIGGTCRSFHSCGYTFDLGIHVLHTKNRYVLKLLRKNNLRLREKKRSAWIYSYNVFTKYPFQANTFGLPKNIINQCLSGLIDVFSKPRQRYDNYEDWIYATFGKGIANNFYLPYSEKFWTVNAKELTTDWLDVRIPRPRLEQVIKGAVAVQEEEFGPNANFQYPQHLGMQRVTEIFLRKNPKIILGKEVSSIDLKKKVIYFSDLTAVPYNKLISTIPLPELPRIIDGMPEWVLAAFRKLRYNSVLCVNFGVKRENLNSWHWVYFPEEKYSAFRVSFPKNFSKFTVPKKWSSIQAEIAYSQSRPIRHKDIVDKVVKDLIRAKIISPRDQVKLINLQNIKYAYVIYDHNRRNSLKVIKNFLNKHNIYNAGRYGQWEYLWMDEAILSGRQILTEIKR